MEKLFGRSYESIGNSSSDLILKCRGQVKVKWGNKYIDLIRDGKIASDGIVLKKVTGNNIPITPGIYITDNRNIYVSDGSNTYNIYGETGSMYVAYSEQNGITGEQKQCALYNIGILFDSIEDLNYSGLQNGIVYIVSTGEIYTVKDGISTLLSFSFPDPITETLSIDVNGIAIEVSSNGSIKVGDITISKDTINYSGSSALNISYNNTSIISIKNNEITINSNVANFNNIITKTISSSSTQLDSNYFSIVQEDSSYVLYIDKIIAKKGIQPIEYTFLEFIGELESDNLNQGTNYIITDFQNPWEICPDPILEDIQAADDEGNLLYTVISTGQQITEEETSDYDDSEITPIIDTPKNVHPIIVTAISSNSISNEIILIDNPNWKVEYDISYQDIIYSRAADTSEGSSDLEDNYYNAETGNIEYTAKGIITKLTDEYNNTCNYDFKHLRFLKDDSWHYTFDNNGQDNSITGNVKNNTILNENYQIIADLVVGYDDTDNEIVQRITIRDGGQTILTGNSSNLIADNLNNCYLYGDINNSTFHGNFNNCTIDSTVYPILSDSTKFKDVYWHNNSLTILCVTDLTLPTGTIIMFNGTTIPSGWALCDGNNGTPNLLNKFVVGGQSPGAEGTVDSGIGSANSLGYYTLVFIIKL